MTHFRDGEGALSLNLRMYDVTIGRWNGVDRQAENYIPISPYAYVANNPMIFIDPNGEEIWLADTEGNRYKYDNGNLYDGEGNRVKNKDLSKEVKTLRNTLITIGSTRNGKKVIKELSKEGTTFDFVPLTPRGNEDGMGFRPTEEGGIIQYGAIEKIAQDGEEKLGEEGKMGAPINAVANELFHAYQQSVGEYSATVSSEFQSDLFSSSIIEELGYYQYSALNNVGMFGEMTMEAISLKKASTINKKQYQVALKNYTKATDRAKRNYVERLPLGKGKPVTLNKLTPLLN